MMAANYWHAYAQAKNSTLKRRIKHYKNYIFNFVAENVKTPNITFKHSFNNWESFQNNDFIAFLYFVLILLLMRVGKKVFASNS